MVRCPICATTLRVPPGTESAFGTAPIDDLAAAAAGAGGGMGAQAGGHARQQLYTQSMGGNLRSTGRRYGFNCGYCSSRLEATESMAAQEGQCPTCGNRITIPILDRYGRLIDPRTRQIIKQDPHPVHAYAAAGDRAPQITRQRDGKQAIVCPRCHGASPIASNNCKLCGMPFTMEGTTVEASGASNGFCVASLVLGIIGLPAFCTHVAPILALVFGVIGYSQVSKSGGEGGGRGMAIAGMICGGIGVLLFLAMDFKWLN